MNKNLQLTAFFTLVSIPIMVIALALLVFIYRYVVIHSLEEQVEQNSIVIAKTLSNVIWEQINVLELMPTNRESQMLNDIYSDVIDRDIYKYLHGTPVLKVKVYSTSGKTIYSTNKSEIGEQKPADYLGSISAETGKPESSFSHRENFKSIEGDLNNVEVLATYIPKYVKDSNMIDGVFEIYTDVTTPIKNIDTSLFNFTIVVLLIFTSIFFALFMLIRHADDVILENKDDLKKKINEVKEMNTALEENAKELASARDVANHANLSKSQFLANMSHELRTPLNAILGYTEIISEDTKKYGDEVVDSDLKKVHQSGAHLLELIDSILDLSKIEAGEMSLNNEAFHLLGMLREVADTLKPIINKNHNTIKLDLELDNELMFGDMLKIRQILYNLLSNAAKFTSNGVITLKSRLLTINGDDKIIFEISDTGIGIAEEHQSKLFDPFQQVDTSATRKYGGTGLGLTITKRFCNMMKGEIEVDSKKGRGTKFIVYLPFVDGSPMAQEAV